jgi:hypothetical protein
MLISDSGGAVDASFLDLALQYKAIEGQNPWSVDGGTSCEAIEAIEKVGYCPKEFSPMESGELSNTINGMFGEKTNNLKHQSLLLDKLKGYLESRSKLKNTTNEFTKKIISQTKTIINKIKKNPNIKLPFPIIKKFPHENRGLSSLYLWGYSNPALDNGVATKDIIPEEKFIKEMETARGRFIEEYTDYIINNPHSPNSIIKIYNKHYSAVTNKFGLSDRFSGTYYKKNLKVFFEYDQKKEYKDELIATKGFYNSLFDNENSMALIKSKYDPRCNEDANSLIGYTKGLAELIEFFDENKIETDLLNESNKDILQLAVAPKCLNEKNRIPLKTKYKCINVHRNSIDGNKGLRNQILKSFLLGHSVGNSYKASSYGHHINTLVGYRYNPNTKKCEYKIRESQTALSTWNDEGSILDNILRLTYLGDSNI